MKVLNILTITTMIMASQSVFAVPTMDLKTGEIACRFRTEKETSELLKLSLDSENEALVASFKDFSITFVNENNRVLIQKGETVLTTVQVNQKVEADQKTQENYVVNDTNTGNLLVQVNCIRMK